MKIKMLIEVDYDGEYFHGGHGDSQVGFYADLLNKEDPLLLKFENSGTSIGIAEVLELRLESVS